MIDERKEELAALYALGLMDERQAGAFEAELRADPELQKFTDDLLHSSAAMVHAAPAKAAPPHLKEKILHKIRAEKATESTAANTRERGKVIPFFGPMSWLPWAMAAGLMVVCGWLSADRNKLADQLESERHNNDVCQMQVAMLNSMNGRQQGVATIIWDASRQIGVLEGRDMPRPAANQDYQLWVLDDRYPQPVDAGVFTVDSKGTARAEFTPKRRVSPIDRFAVTLEKKGGAREHEGPIVMMGGANAK